MGEPSSLTGEQKRLLQDCARPFISSRVTAAEGRLQIALAVKGHGLVYFELQPAEIKNDRGYDYCRVMQDTNCREALVKTDRPHF